MVTRQRDSTFLMFCLTVYMVTVNITNVLKRKPATALVFKKMFHSEHRLKTKIDILRRSLVVFVIIIQN